MRYFHHVLFERRVLITALISDVQRANMNEFYPADKIDAALSLDGLPYTTI